MEAREINRDQPACYGAFAEVFDEVPVDIDLPVTVGAWRAFTGVAEPAATPWKTGNGATASLARWSATG
jgi:hypothetical protein